MSKKKPVKHIKLYGQTIQEFAQTILVDPVFETRTVTVAVKYPCDLRSRIAAKIEEISPFSTWTVFLNDAGTMAHVFNKKGTTMTRMLIDYPLKGARQDYREKKMRQLVLETFYGR